MIEKLIRDKLDRVIPANRLRIEDDPQIQRTLLIKKLAEEYNELIWSKFADVEEYADMMDVLEELAKRHNISAHDIEECREKKNKAKGGFVRGLILKG